MDDSGQSMLLVTLTAPSSGSVSPMTPSPSRDFRGANLFRAIGRKLGRRSNDDISYIGEDDSRSSSTDSCSSTSASRCFHSIKSFQNEHTDCSSSSGFRSTSPHHISSSGSDSSCESPKDTKLSKHHRHHSTSVTSFRKVFESLSLNSRSQSCSGNSNKETKRKSKKSTPKKILRPPMTYTYVRGLSGLPTQRIPRLSSHVYMTQNGCCCGQQLISRMNR